MTATLFVYWGSKLIGRLWLDEQRKFIFQYQQDWVNNPDALPISLQLPLRNDVYENDGARPFFSNLLPESDIRKLLAARYKISERNDFGLLEEIGGECAGALSLLREEKQPANREGYKKITEEHLDERIAHMSIRPLLSPEGAERLSLAGAQNKLPVYVKNQKLFLPLGSSPSSHILKPQIPFYEETVENEAFCMQLALKTGLNVPEVTIYQTPKNKLLLIKRYDRLTDKKENLVRLHQEDFCQALGILPDQKYENEGGPNFKKCFDLITTYSSNPLRDKINFIKWALFNFLIGNSDAHAKNISVLITQSGFFLAPFYDLMSTNVYEGLNTKFSMKIGGKYNRREIVGRHWGKFAEEAGVKTKIVVDTAMQMAEELPMTANNQASGFVKKFGGKKIVNRICGFIEKESKVLLSILR